MARLCACLAMIALAGAAGADPGASVDDERRAGYPQATSRFARPSDTGRYQGGLVGGGNVWFGKAEGPAPGEGTWGWDYVGGPFQRRVFLGWWHGRRYQGGPGAYQTDGPRILKP